RTGPDRGAPEQAGLPRRARERRRGRRTGALRAVALTPHLAPAPAVGGGRLGDGHPDRRYTPRDRQVRSRADGGGGPRRRGGGEPSGRHRARRRRPPVTAPPASTATGRPRRTGDGLTSSR